MNRLERYLLRNMLAGVGMVLLIMSALVVFVNLVSQVEDLGDTQFSAGQLLFYVILRLPAFLFHTIPVAVLIGTLLGLGGLAVQRELIAMRAVGLSLWQMTRATLFAAVLIGMGAWILGDVAGPPAEAMAQQMRNAQRLGGIGTRLSNQVWLRDGSCFVSVDRLISSRLLDGIKVMAFDEEGRLQQIVRAPRAAIEPDGWLLFDVEATRFEGESATGFREAQVLWPLHIEPRTVEVLAVKPETLTLTELWRQIHFLEENGLQADLFAVLFWSRLITAVSVLPMMLLALPLVLGGLRDSSMVRRVGAGVGIGAIYYLVNLTVGGGGAVLGLPVVVSAWLPTVLLTLVACWSLVRTR